jgi:hypothetical protein
MKKESIKRHLSKYLISQRRGTTINHAFASAIAPCDPYNEEKVREALLFLGQDPDGELVCIFCEGKAQTWDHLTSLVKRGELNGFGHQLGNLVPCCKDCNSSKGAKDFSLFVEKFPSIKSDRGVLIEKLKNYSARFSKPLNIQLLDKAAPEKWNRYNQIKSEIMLLLKEADDLAEHLRRHVVE